jgi:hypothetical protein
MLSVTRLRDIAARVWPRVTARAQQDRDWVRRNPRTALWTAGITVAVALLVLLITHWNPYKAQREAFTPLFTLAAGLAVAGVTLMRHFAQTEADRQRRITESFSKAIEQLGSDKPEVRLGGIYALERISQESPQDHWTVMENLTAFVRERTRPQAERLAKPLEQRVAERAYRLWENASRPKGRSDEFWAAAVEQENGGEPAGTDIAAVLAVIWRRSEKYRALEIRDERVLDFWRAVFQGADLPRAHLERAFLMDAHLERAFLIEAHLQDAQLTGGTSRTCHPDRRAS